MSPAEHSSSTTGHAQAPDLAIARLRDYFGRRTNWQRRLWNPGTVVVLREALEASQLLETGHLRERAVVDLARTAERRAGPDLGVGPPALRTTLQASLREVHKSPIARYELEYLLKSVGPNYLGRWSEALVSEPGKLATEHASRILAGHLLGLGFSPHYLHRWATWLRQRRKPATLSDVFAEAEKVARRQSQAWSVFVPFDAIDRQEQRMPEEWLEPQAATEWMRREVPRTAARQNGGFLLDIKAPDPWAAVEQANDSIESLAARVAVGKRGRVRFEHLSKAFVSGSNKEFLLGRPRRQVNIRSLKRQNALFSVNAPALAGRLRSAIDLVAPLETGAPGAAVAGGWAALEAALARPDTPNSEAARDLAVLVACSFPRAELTPLTHAYTNQLDDALSRQLRSARSNLERCELLGAAIRDNEALEFGNPSDRAAVERIRGIIAEPQAVLNRVVGYVEEALLRLYRQRNMVLHAGKTDSVAMSSALRTAPPLVGAGFDRLVHDALTVGDSDPLRLVARARIELSMCGKEGGSSIWDLLGH